MNYKMIRLIIGRIMCIEALFMVPPVVISIAEGDGRGALSFLAAIALLACIGLPMAVKKAGKKLFYAREGFVTVGLSWIIVSAFGAVPFYVSGAVSSFVDCFFESVSGFTTTGATVLKDVEALSTGLLYWRSFTHWLGGMGVLVFVLAIMPLTKASGETMHLLRAESPGPLVGKLVPRMHRSAMILYGIYIALTVLQILLMLAGGNRVLDSVLLTFSTAGTGGFAIRNDSLASYSAYTQILITIFMLLFSINFNMFYFLLMRDFKRVLGNEELRVFLLIIAVSITIITINVMPLFETVGEALRQSAFTVSAVISTTGFASGDFNVWPQLSRHIILMLMMIGACAGSTGGGIKVMRFLIMIKSMGKAVVRALHPNSVKLIHIQGEVLDEDAVNAVSGYMIVYFGIAAASLLLLSLDGLDVETNLTAVLACLNNAGPGFGELIGPIGNYSGFSAPAKLLLSANMLIGRLEIYPILVLLTPSVWKR